MKRVNLPAIVAHRKLARPATSRRSFFFIMFVVLLLLVAGMGLYSSWHIHGAGLDTESSKIMNSVLKRSEDQLIHTAQKIATVIDTTSSYLNHKLRAEHPSLTQLITSVREVPTPQRKRLAYAITITKDGFFQDGAAVLAYSIMKYSVNSTYDISLIAFVHPNVTTSRIGLRRLGFHVIEVPTPVNTSAIRFPFLRDHIDKNGCCGAAELIKITSYRYAYGTFQLSPVLLMYYVRR